MKCTNWIIVEISQCKPTCDKMHKHRKPKEIIVDSRTWFMWKNGQGFHYQSPEYIKQQECRGNIKANVSISGGCCGKEDIEIEYKCDRCNGTSYPELPTAGRLSEFLTNFISKLTEDEHYEMKEATWAKEIESRKIDAEFRKKMGFKT